MLSLGDRNADLGPEQSGSKIMESPSFWGQKSRLQRGHIRSLGRSAEMTKITPLGQNRQRARSLSHNADS